MCGEHCQIVNSICIIAYMFGCCVTFLILIGDQLEQGIVSQDILYVMQNLPKMLTHHCGHIVADSQPPKR